MSKIFPSYHNHLRDLPAWFDEIIERDGVCVFDTCNTSSYGWDLNKHNAMIKFYCDGLPGYHFSYKYEFECFTWTVMKDRYYECVSHEDL
jgi:hypothetical protein